MFGKLIDRFGKPVPNADRKSMEAALKSRCIPALREQGFKGTFPNFYRERGKFVALVNFQFFSSGGSFCVNLGYADPDRKNVHFKPKTEPRDLRVSGTHERIRLGSEGKVDSWFIFGETNYGELRGTPQNVNEIAGLCARLFATEAESWWADKAKETNS